MPSLLLTMAAMMMMSRCVFRRLLSPHPLVCRRFGDTALIHAVRYGHASTVRLLVESRADLTCEGNLVSLCAKTCAACSCVAAAHARGCSYGETALGIAIRFNRAHIAAFLRSAGVAE